MLTLLLHNHYNIYQSIILSLFIGTVANMETLNYSKKKEVN
jgi:hypothetical protein